MSSRGFYYSSSDKAEPNLAGILTIFKTVSMVKIDPKVQGLNFYFFNDGETASEDVLKSNHPPVLVCFRKPGSTGYKYNPHARSLDLFPKATPKATPNEPKEYDNRLCAFALLRVIWDQQAVGSLYYDWAALSAVKTPINKNYLAANPSMSLSRATSPDTFGMSLSQAMSVLRDVCFSFDLSRENHDEAGKSIEAIVMKLQHEPILRDKTDQALIVVMRQLQKKEEKNALISVFGDNDGAKSLFFASRFNSTNISDIIDDVISSCDQFDMANLCNPLAPVTRLDTTVKTDEK